MKTNQDFAQSSGGTNGKSTSFYNTIHSQGNDSEKPAFSLELMQQHLEELTKQEEPKMANHREITELLLAQIKKVDFREVISLPEGEDLKQKHIIYAIVKNLLKVSKDNKWNLVYIPMNEHQ